MAGRKSTDDKLEFSWRWCRRGWSDVQRPLFIDFGEEHCYYPVQVLEKHFGEKQSSHNLVLSPLSIEAGMSVRIKNKSGYDLYAIVGPDINSKNQPRFDSRTLMQKLVLHEFSHPFCNPVIEASYKQFQKDSCLFSPVKSQLEQQGCGDWKSALKELLTRANEIELIAQVFGKETADKIYNEYIKQGWIYIQGLRPIIEKYESNRRKYGTIQELTPEIILYLDHAAKVCK